MSKQALKEFDQCLHQILKTLTSASDSDSSTLIKTFLEQANTLQKYYIDNPVVGHLRFLAAAQQYPAVKRCLLTLGLLLLVAHRNRISETVIQHFAAGCLLGAALLQTKSPSRRKALYRDSCKGLLGTHFAVMRWILNGFLQPKSKAAYNYSQAMQEQIAAPASIAITVASFLSSDDHGQSRGTVTALQKLVVQRPELSQFLQHVLAPDSPLWLGHVVVSGGRKGIVVGADQENVFLASKCQEQGSQGFVLHQLPVDQFVAKLELKRAAPPKTCLAAYIQLTEQTDFPVSHASIYQYGVQRPPAELIAILGIIQKGAEPSKIATVVSENTLFSAILQRSASQLTRLNINVINITQSIMTHGTDRLAAVLTEHILWQRLTHSAFPLFRQFYTFAALHRFVSAQIAQQCQLGIAQQFSLYATFQVSALFTTPVLRLLPKWHWQNLSIVGTDGLFEAKHAPEFNSHAQILSKAWHQHTSTQKNTYHDVNQISLFLCRAWLHEGLSSDADVLNRLQNECKRIQLQAKHIESIRRDAAEMLVWPI